MSEAAQPVSTAATATPSPAPAPAGGDGVPRAPEVPLSVTSFGVTPHPGIEGDKPIEPEAPGAPTSDSKDPAAPAAEPGKEATPATAAGTIEVTVRGEKRSYTPQQATHLIQTLVGQYKARETREAAAAASATGWHAEAERRQARITELEAQLKGSASAPATGAPTSGPAKDGAAPAAVSANGEIDWKLVNDIANHAEGGPMVAMHYVVQEMNRLAEAREARIRDQVKSELSQQYQPLLDERAESGQLRELEELVSRASTTLDPRSGQPAYPELKDPAAIEGIAQALTDLAPHLRPESLMTPYGLHQAVMLYRYKTNGTVMPSAPATAAPTQMPPPTPTDAALAGALSGVEPPAGRPQAPGSTVGDMASLIRNAPKGDPVFGVTPHRGY